MSRMGESVTFFDRSSKQEYEVNSTCSYRALSYSRSPVDSRTEYDPYYTSLTMRSTQCAQNMDWARDRYTECTDILDVCAPDSARFPERVLLEGSDA